MLEPIDPNEPPYHSGDPLRGKWEADRIKKEMVKHHGDFSMAFKVDYDVQKLPWELLKYNIPLTMTDCSLGQPQGSQLMSGTGDDIKDQGSGRGLLETKWIVIFSPA